MKRRRCDTPTVASAPAIARPVEGCSTAIGAYGCGGGGYACGCGGGWYGSCGCAYGAGGCGGYAGAGGVPHAGCSGAAGGVCGLLWFSSWSADQPMIVFAGGF